MFLILTMAGGNLGYGHLGRCLPLFHELQRQGHDVRILAFNGGDEPIHCDAPLVESDWVSNISELDISCSDIVIVDVLGVDVETFYWLQNRARALFIIDDVNVEKYREFNRIDWSIKTHVLSKHQCQAYSSPNLVPLKPAFTRFEKKIIKEQFSTILLTLGGSDVRSLSPQIIQFLNQHYPRLNVIVLVGPSFRCLKEIKKVSKDNVRLLDSPSEQDIASAMEQCDLAIATGGHTMYELAAAGVPTVQLQVIENQEVSRYWDEFGFSYYVGWYCDDRFYEKLKCGIEFFRDFSSRAHASQLGQSIIDGYGAKRLINRLVRDYVG